MPQAWGSDEQLEGWMTGTQDAADKYGYAVAYPEGGKPAYFPLGLVGDSWNAGACCPEACADKVDDVSFVRAVVADATSKLSVNEDKLFCLGMSNGAFMTNRVACEASDLFKAFAASSGPLV